jgi:hypothetical protein
MATEFRTGLARTSPNLPNETSEERVSSGYYKNTPRNGPRRHGIGVDVGRANAERENAYQPVVERLQ